MSSLVCFTDFVKEYESNGQKIRALDGINLEIESGDIYGIIGYSGAGKSTLIRGINGIEKPTEGTITVGEQKVNELSTKSLREFRKKTGMIFQHFNLMPSRTVFENVALPLKKSDLSSGEKKRRVDELLDYVGLLDKSNVYPAQLSGGQKQRVSIARALAHNPEILLCDEATSALDPQTTLSILSLLKRLNQTLGITIVLITHEMSVIKEICNKVAIIDAGKILEQGDVFDVFTKPNYSLTREFIETTSNLAKVKDVIKVYIEKKQPKIDGVVFLRLNFVDNQVQDSVIMSVVKSQRVDINILLADISFLDNKQLGSLFVALTGENKREAIEALKKKGVQVEVVIYE